MKRTFIREYKGWPGINVEYLATYDNGATQKCLCSKEEWVVMETRDKLLAGGADPKLLDIFEDAAGDVARLGEWASNLGEEL